MAWSSPRTWVAAETVTAALMNAHVRDQLLHIAGTSGFTGTPSATRGIEPTSGYFMGAVSQNRHVESGRATLNASATTAVTFANAYADTSANVTTSTQTAGEDAQALSVTASGFTLSHQGAENTVICMWISEGPD